MWTTIGHIGLGVFFLMAAYGWWVSIYWAAELSGEKLGVWPALALIPLAIGIYFLWLH